MQISDEWKATWLQAISRVVNLDERPLNDSILHFNIWRIDEKALQDCFSIFPKGLDMLERAKVAREIKPKNVITEDYVLVNHLFETNLRLEKLLGTIGSENEITSQQNKNKLVRDTVYRGDEKARIHLMGDAASITECVDDRIGDMFEELYGSDGANAHSFLRDPFYYIANSVTIQNWIFWGAFDEAYDSDPYAPEIELYKLNAESGWNGKEMFAFQLDPDE